MKYKIDLDKDKNPKYISLINEYNMIMDKYNLLNDELFDTEVPKIVVIGNKRKKEFIKIFNKLKDNIIDLQSKFSEWNKEARKFYINPNFIVNEEKSEFIVEHYLRILWSLISELNEAMSTIVGSQRSIQALYHNKYNFQVAILGLILAEIGLFISLYK